MRSRRTNRTRSVARINKLVGHLGERMAGLEGRTAKIERNMAAISQAQQKQGALVEQIMLELRRLRGQGAAGEAGTRGRLCVGRVG